MTQKEAEEIKNRIEDLNKRYAPIKLNFKMYPSEHRHDDGNWFVTIVYNYTPDEWFTLFGMNHSYAQVPCHGRGRGFKSRLSRFAAPGSGKVLFSILKTLVAPLVSEVSK